MNIATIQNQAEDSRISITIEKTDDGYIVLADDCDALIGLCATENEAIDAIAVSWSAPAFDLQWI